MPSPSEAATALVVGYDQRAGAHGFGVKDSRSDTLMLIRADPQNDTLSLLSFPRDLDVPIYCNRHRRCVDRPDQLRVVAAAARRARSTPSRS